MRSDEQNAQTADPLCLCLHARGTSCGYRKFHAPAMRFSIFDFRLDETGKAEKNLVDQDLRPLTSHHLTPQPLTPQPPTPQPPTPQPLTPQHPTPQHPTPQHPTPQPLTPQHPTTNNHQQPTTRTLRPYVYCGTAAWL